MAPGNFMALTKATLSDGILNGCGITASGANITVAAGRIVAGGALIVVESTTVTATGAGELVLRVDTSGEGSASILARSAVTLTKQDITAAGTIYEVQLATFGFSSGAVSGLSVKIGASKPFGGTNVFVQQSQPSNPSTGDLWFW